MRWTLWLTVLQPVYKIGSKSIFQLRLADTVPLFRDSRDLGLDLTEDAP